jgi:hypothetical protein
MRPVDILKVTAGQDRGARFGFPGAEATIGRGPTMDLVLTDPRVSACHAVLRVDGDRLTVTDLGAGGGTRVNGMTRSGPVALSPGDRIGIGGTELTVVWTPTGAVAPPTVGGPPPPPPAEPVSVAATPRRTRRAVPMPVLLAGAGLVAALLGLAATTMPALEGPRGAVSLWTIDPEGLRALAALTSLAALALAAGWLGVELSPERRDIRGVMAMATAGAGGLLAGIPLLIAALPTPGARTGEALGALTVAGLLLIAAPLARVRLLAGPRRGPAPGNADPRATLVGVAGLGGILAALAAPLAWTSTGGESLSGFDAAITAGRWLVPLALATSAACAIAALVGRLVERRTTAPACTVALGLTTLTLSFTVAGAVALSAGTAGAGLILAVTGAAIGATTCAAGALAIAADLRDPPPAADAAGQTMAAAAQRLG